MKEGFTLLEVLVVSLILASLCILAVYFINPFELIKLRHDADKLIELSLMQTSITQDGFEATKSANFALDFCANEDGWEINTALESKGQIEKMKIDKGNSDLKYEIGTNLNCQK